MNADQIELETRWRWKISMKIYARVAAQDRADVTLDEHKRTDKQDSIKFLISLKIVTAFQF